jgi:hypothetical protein
MTADNGLPSFRTSLKELEVDDGAGQGSGDSFDRLNPGDYQLAEGVDVGRDCLHDHVIRTGYVVGRFDTLDGADFLGDVSGLAYFGLDEHECLDHGTSYG